jgi:glycosyltransferase involved in cell wall biosynthesis
MENKTIAPLVSVLMTVYNREAYLVEAIESVIASTYQHWELIVVDDRSKDSSLAIAESYAAKDPRIKVFLNETNLGDYPNRNQAAAYAQGKYLKYVDADDLIYPYGLEQLVHYMEQFPNAGFGLCSIAQDKELIFPFELSPNETYVRHFVDKKHVFNKAPLSSIIKRSVFEEASGFANVRHYGDFELWLRLAKLYNIVLMPHGVVWYRSSEGQEKAVRQKNPLNALKTFQTAINHIQQEDCPLEAKQKHLVIEKYKKLSAAVILFAFRKIGWSKGVELKEYSKMSFLDIIKYKFAK